MSKKIAILHTSFVFVSVEPLINDLIAELTPDAEVIHFVDSDVLATAVPEQGISSNTTTPNDLVQMMVGRELEDLHGVRTSPVDATATPTLPAPAGPDAVPVDELPWRSTPGTFEIVRVDGGGFLLRLVDGNGMVLALSRTYPDISAAVKGVEAVREGAATSHISDQTARPPVSTRSGWTPGP
ncbi:YegP family protein [Arthrobacter sp. Y81]|uniref:YegP family protein n=1 Tax=Arthrobacter sp. Y81 TaxID=2058897 RepID=UPI002157354D|nr:YegP family protein [Arthrobacter sp. Y81]